MPPSVALMRGHYPTDRHGQHALYPPRPGGRRLALCSGPVLGPCARPVRSARALALPVGWALPAAL